jgi:hypothetical protein
LDPDPKLGGKWDPDPKKIVTDPQHWYFRQSSVSPSSKEVKKKRTKADTPGKQIAGWFEENNKGAKSILRDENNYR